MKSWIKCLFGRHEYEKIRDRHYEKHKGFVIVQGVYKCRKCGKIQYK